MHKEFITTRGASLRSTRCPGGWGCLPVGLPPSFDPHPVSCSIREDSIWILLLAKYFEFYATRYLGSTVMMRPELRFDHSWDARGYDNGTARNQFFFGMDLIYKF